MLFALAFSPNGQKLLSGDGEGVLRLWNADGLRELSTFKGHEGLKDFEKVIFSVAFASDGKTFASAGGDGTARLWDAKNLQNLAILTHQGRVRWLLFRPITRSWRQQVKMAE